MCDAKVAKKVISAVKPVKRRNSEKRKEKSRDAARCRRSKETEIFFEMADLLPLPASALSQMDKASIMRLTISFLKIRSIVDSDIDFIKRKTSSPLANMFQKALDGFVLLMSEDGDMIYLSQNIDSYLGLSQMDLMGNSIFDYSHPCDHDDIKDLLSLKTSQDIGSVVPFSIFVRMKNTLNGKGRCLTIRSASYKVIHFTGRIIRKPSSKKKESDADVKENPASTIVTMDKCFLSIGEPIPHPSNIEVPLGKQTFLSRHSLDMKFTYVDDRIADVLGYKSEELLGQSVFLYFHVGDCRFMEKYYKILFHKGQCETINYRFLAKFGGYVWVLTQGTIIYEGTTNKPQCVVCVNYILSGIEQKDEVVSTDQTMPRAKSPPPVIESIEEPIPSLPQANTNKIFAPRTADMNTGFLTFVDDEGSLIVSKEEPEDLTHLAPQAGDVCIPLDMTDTCPDLFEDVLLDNLDAADSSMLFGEYEKYLQFEKNGSYEDSGSMEDHLVTSARSPLLVDKDPFLTNRDDPLLSSDSGKYMLDSARDKLENRDTRPNPRRATASILERLNLVTAKDKEEFSLRAPYIPMSDVVVDDFLLIDSPVDPLQLQDVSRKGEDSLLLTNSAKPNDLGGKGMLISDELWKLPESKISSASIKSDLVKLLKGDLRQQKMQMRKIDLSGGPSVAGSKVTVTKNRKAVTVNPVIIRKPNGTTKNSQGGVSPVIITSRVKRDNIQSNGNANLTYLNNNFGALAKVLQQNGSVRPPPNKFATPSPLGAQHKTSNGSNGTSLTSSKDSDHEWTEGSGNDELRSRANGLETGSPLTSIENERPFPTPPDPPPKRNCSLMSQPGPSDSSPKKFKTNPTEINQTTAQKSVLLNLLLNGEDKTHGYFCPVNNNNNNANNNQTTKYNKSTATFLKTSAKEPEVRFPNGKVAKSSTNQSYLINRVSLLAKKDLIGNKRAMDLPALL